MASLTGTKIKDTYDGLLKTTDNGALGASAKLITDGLGNSSGVYLGTSGNVGIGVNPSYKLDVSSVSRFTDGFYLAQATAGTNASIYLGSDQTLELEAFGASGEIAFSTGSSVAERMRIDSSGNVGINCTPSSKMHLAFNTDFDGLRIQNASRGHNYLLTTTGVTAQAFSIYDLDNSANLAVFGNDASVFYTGETERMRITSGGDVIFGGASSLPNGTSVYGAGFSSDSNSRMTLLTATSTTSANNLIEFYNPNGNVGKIQTSGSSTIYATSSDYRLKEDWQPMSDALTRIDALKPVNFAWKSDGKRVDGFLAHELQEVIPEAVTGEKDAMRDEEYEVSPAVYEDVVHPAEEAVYETIEHPAIAEELDADGNVIVAGQEAYTEQVLVSEAKEEWTERVLVSEAVMGTRSVPEYQGIDQSKIVPLLVAAIQELKAEVDALKGA